MRAACAVLLATTLLATSALAGGVQQAGSLAPGKPAGVSQAQSTAMTVTYVVLGAGVLLAGALAIQSSGGGAVIVGTAPLDASTLPAYNASTLNTFK
jgi:hypothetical protein